MTQWYYAQQGQRRGPVGEEDLISLIRAGDIHPSDLAWTRGMPQWAPVANISALARANEPEEEAPVAAPEPTSFWDRRKAGLNLKDIQIKKEWTWRILVLAGAGLLFLAFLLPWWGIWKSRSIDSAQAERIRKVESRNENWYNAHYIDAPRRDKWLWGPGTGSGIVGLLFALLIVPLTVVPILVKAAQPWGWIGSFVTAVLGLVVLVLALVWFFACPGEDVPPIFYQGMLVGPYVFFLASLLILGGGITEGVLGLLAFLKSRKTTLPPAT